MLAHQTDVLRDQKTELDKLSSEIHKEVLVLNDYCRAVSNLFNLVTRRGAIIMAGLN